MKKFLSTALALLITVLLPLSAQTFKSIEIEPSDNNSRSSSKGQAELTYATTELTSIVGTGSPGEFSAAIVFSAGFLSGYANCEVTKLKIGLSSQGGTSFTKTKVWIAASRTGAILAEQEFTAKDGWNDVVFSTPFTITGTTDLWFGYTVTVAGADPRPMYVTANESNPNGGHLSLGNRTTSGNWTTLAGNDIAGNLAISAVVDGEFEEVVDLSVESVDVPSMGITGESLLVKATIRQASKILAKDFKFSYVVDGGTDTVTTDITNAKILMDGTLSITHPTPITFTTTGVKKIEVIVSAVGDNNTTNNIKEGTITIVEANEAFQRKILWEQITGTWCPPCGEVKDLVYNMIGRNENVIWVDHHVNSSGAKDPFTQAASQPYIGHTGSLSVPQVMIDRTTVIGDIPAFHPAGPLVLATIANRLKVFTSISIENINVEFNEADMGLQVTVGGLKNIAHPAEGTNITIFIVEDSLVGSQAGQSNPKFIHSHVFRQELTETWGEAISFEENNFSFEISGTLSSVVKGDASVVIILTNEATKEVYNAGIAAIDYKRIFHTITFDKNGGLGIMNPQDFEDGVEGRLPANKFIKTKHSFTGWSISATGAVEYANLAKYTATKDITLFAVWKLREVSNELMAATKELSIYTANDNIVIKQNSEIKERNIEIYNMQGQRIARKVSAAEIIEIPVKTAGIYVVVCGNEVQKVVIH